MVARRFCKSCVAGALSTTEATGAGGGLLAAARAPLRLADLSLQEVIFAVGGGNGGKEEDEEAAAPGRRRWAFSCFLGGGFPSSSSLFFVFVFVASVFSFTRGLILGPPRSPLEASEGGLSGGGSARRCEGQAARGRSAAGAAPAVTDGRAVTTESSSEDPLLRSARAARASSRVRRRCFSGRGAAAWLVALEWQRGARESVDGILSAFFPFYFGFFFPSKKRQCFIFHVDGGDDRVAIAT